jgi:hypothetical protein
MIGLPFSGLTPRSPTALALPPCRRTSGMTTRKTAPDRRAARFLSSTSWQAYRGDVFDRNPAAYLASAFFIY